MTTLNVNSYQVGDLVRLTGTFTDSADAAVDPAAITLVVKKPDLTTATYTFGGSPALTQDTPGNGIFYADVSATDAGRWHYRFFSTGAGQAAGSHVYNVEADPTA